MNMNMAVIVCVTLLYCLLWLQPDFSKEPLMSDDAVNSWLRFYEMSSPLTCLSEFVSHDPVSVIERVTHE